MRRFIISIKGEKFEVDVEEVSPQRVVAAPTIKSHRNGESKPKQTEVIDRPKKGSLTVDAPMPGNIVKIFVKEGDEVTKGQKVFLLEAMKMENEIGAPASGRVVSIQVKVGDAVASGDTVIILE